MSRGFNIINNPRHFGIGSRLKNSPNDFTEKFIFQGETVAGGGDTVWSEPECVMYKKIAIQVYGTGTVRLQGSINPNTFWVTIDDITSPGFYTLSKDVNFIRLGVLESSNNIYVKIFANYPFPSSVQEESVFAPSDITGLSLWLEGDEANLTYQGSVTITQISVSSGTATVTTGSAHGLATGDVAIIAGATLNNDLNGNKTVTVVNTTSFAYATTSGNGTDTTNGMTCTPNSPRVSSWNDLSTQSNDATQNTIINQAKFNTDHLIFTGDEFFNISTLTIEPNSFTVFIVYDVTTFATINYMLLTSSRGFYSGGTFSGVNGYGFVHDTLSTAVEANTEPTAKGIMVGETGQLWRNGIEPTYDNQTPMSTNLDLVLVAGRDAANLRHIGKIYAILVYTNELNILQKNQVGQYLANKYTLTWTDIS